MTAAAPAAEAGTDLLFRPFPFGRTTLRNRIVMAPMTRSRCPGGVPGEEVAAYYRRRALAEVGLIISEGAYIDFPGASAYPDVPHFYGKSALAGWRQVIDAVHDAGGKMIPQLWHVGSVRQRGMPPDPAVPGYGPSAVVKDGVALAEALTKTQIAEAAQSYARSARAAQDIGFDGVALHGGHGYLFDQFFWHVSNRRSDEYGGTLDNRCRFATEVIQAIRRAVGPDFPIVLRFSQWKMHDYEAKIAATPDELAIILRALTQAGVDVLDPSTRRFWLPAFEGSDKTLAAWTKELSGKTVMAVGSVGLDQPHQSKVFRRPDNVGAKVTDIRPVLAAMARNDFDLVEVGRALLADHEWVQKVRTGAIDRIKAYTFDTVKTYF